MKMKIISKLIYKFNLVKMADFVLFICFWEILKSYSEIYLEKQVHDLAKSTLKKKDIVVIFKTYYLGTVIQTLWYWFKNRQNEYLEQSNRWLRDRAVLRLTLGSHIQMWERTDCLLDEKNKIKPNPYLLYRQMLAPKGLRIYFQNDHEVSRKCRNHCDLCVGEGHIKMQKAQTKR